MTDPEPAARAQHHRHLEQARAQIMELLSRQAVVQELISRSEKRKQDVVQALVARQHQAALEQRLAHFHPADIAFVLEGLPPEQRRQAWALVRPDRRGAVLLEAGDAMRRALVAEAPAEEIAALVKPLDSDEIADLLGSLPEETRQRVLSRLDRSDQAEVRSVLSFPEGTVGAEMDLDFVAVREDATVEAVQRLLRLRKKLPPQTNQLFVVTRSHELRGLLSLHQLLVSEPETPVAEVMTPDVASFNTDDPIEEAVNAFERYDLISAPVVNLHRQVVGRITVDAVVDAINERAQRQRLEEVGLSEDQDLYAPLRRAARARWPWLAINLGTAFLASRVIGLFEHMIQQIVALAVLMPIVASIGGNTGNQTVALVIRALALNRLDGAQLRLMFAKELGIGAFNGLVWGVVLGLLTLLLYRDLGLSGVIALAMLLELTLAAAIGMAVPLTLHRLGRDPVRGASIFLTFATDSLGFFVFLGLAAALLG